MGFGFPDSKVPAVMKAPIRRIFRRQLPDPHQRLREFHERVIRVERLPVREAERALGVKQHSKGSDDSGYISHLVYRQVRLKR